MTQSLQNAFALDDTYPCITETNNSIIEVYDCYGCSPATQRSYIRTNDQEPIHFTLTNPANTTLTFAALDNCILKPNDAARCDFILGNYEKLYFVEIKQTNTKQRSQARSDAMEQLFSAILLLKSLVNLEITTIVAVICLGAKKVYPLKNATSIAQAFAFKSTLNATLMEGQGDTF